jgi:hypothetical protein
VAIVLSVIVLVMVAIPRVHGPGRDLLTKVWKIGAWVLAAGALGLVFDSIMQAMCDGLCGATLPGQGRRPSLLVYVPLVAGTIGITWLVDRAGDALRRRALTRP